MKITINNKGFASALSIGGAMAGRVKSLPILDCVKIAVSSGNAVITSFDNECSISKQASILSVDEDGEFCINPKDLGGVIKTLKDEEVSLVIGDSNCEIIHSKGSVSLPVLPALDFPTPAEDDSAKTIPVPAESFYYALKNAQNYVSNDFIRPVLSGIYIEVDGDNVVVASSDARKLFFDKFGITDTVSDKVVSILTSKAISAILGAISGDDTIKVSFGERNIGIWDSDVKITCRKIDGSYPDVRRVIPMDNPIRVKVSKSSIKDTVKRAALTTDSSKKMLRLSISASKEMRIESKDLGHGKICSETVLCEEVSGIADEFVIGVNGDNLIDGIQSVESDYIILEMSSPSKGFLVLDDKFPEKKILLMPITLD